MKTKLFCFFSIILLNFFNAIIADNNISYYTIDNGLSSNSVYSISQDIKGRMWFGTTDGLHSFDGNKIKVWRDKGISTLGQNIYTLLTDSCYIYVGSDNGLSIFNLETESFLTLDKLSVQPANIYSKVKNIMRDRTGRIWIATLGQGLFSYDKSTGGVRQYMAPSVIGSDYIIHVFEDSEGVIWAASRDRGVYFMLPSDNKFQAFSSSPITSFAVLFEDSQKRIWAGSEVNGLFLLDRSKNMFIEKKLNVNHSSHLSIRGITEVNDNVLWLATEGGLVEYDIINGISRLIFNDNESESLNDNHLHCLFTDNRKGIWIGSYFGGANHISSHKQCFKHYKPGVDGLNANIISVFAKADNNNVWIGTDDNGVFYWDRNKDTFTDFSVHTGGLKQTHINTHAILQDKDILYIGTYMGGLDVFNLKTKEKDNYKHDIYPNSLYSSDIYYIIAVR